MGVHADSIDILMDFGAGPVSMKNDIVWKSVKWRRGIDGSGPTDRTATTGFLRYTLRNDSGNTAGLLGNFSPGHANARAGFDVVIPVWLKIAQGGQPAVTQWTGTVASIRPAPGRKGSRLVDVACVDWIEEAATADVNELALLVNATGDTAMTSLVAQVSKAPVATSFQTGVSTFPFLFDQVGDEAKVLQEIARVTRSEFGQAWVSKAGTFKWENRFTRAISTSQFTFTNVMGFEAVRDRTRLLNRVRVTSHPRRVGGGGEVLYQHDGIPYIEPGETLTLDASYRDPDLEATHVGGRSMSAFTATTDYLANTASDGSGTDLTGTVVTTGTFMGANAARFVLANPSSNPRIYITRLKCRGTSLKDYSPLTAMVEDLVKQGLYGLNPIDIDLPCDGDANRTAAFAAWVLAVFGAGWLEVKKVYLEANRNAALLAQAVNREISDRITIQDDVTAVNADYFINAVEGELTGPRSFRVAWVVAPADAYNYFVWDTSEWDDPGSVWGFA